MRVPVSQDPTPNEAEGDCLARNITPRSQVAKSASDGFGLYRPQLAGIADQKL
jgi:hypothetical protein